MGGMFGLLDAEHPPLVSVIVPVFNQQRFVGRCLRSICAQTLEDSKYEVVVVDDGSTDETGRILESFEGRIRLITSPTNQGLPKSLNTAIRASEGNYIVRLDSDDYVSTEFLRLMLWHMSEYRSHAVACDYWLVDDDEKRDILVSAIDSPIGCGIMFRRDCMESVGLYNEDFTAHEDKEFMLRFAKRFSVSHLPLALYRYRRHLTNMTNNEQLMRSFEKKLSDIVPAD